MTHVFEWSARSLDDGLEGWSALLSQSWPAYRNWWLQDGIEARPPLDLCHAALDRHMHELLPLWERLSQSASEEQKRFLSFWAPPAYIKACSQIAQPGETPVLVRNYDYGADAFDGLVLRTDWMGRRVIGVSDGLWGLLDGMNDAGLAVSLSFGGRWQTGNGFGIPLILRYVLQTCATVAQAIKVLRRVPTHMSYNVTCLDTSGETQTIMVGPDRPGRVVDRGYATNHQSETPEWPEHAKFTRTRTRFNCLKTLVEKDLPPDELVGKFLKAPLYTAEFKDGFGTLYTASYEPGAGRMGLHWPGCDKRMSLSDTPRWDEVVQLGKTGAAA